MTEFTERIVLTALGPILGSCIGLLTLRLPAGAPVALARSACAGCERKLGIADLIPILSWLLLRGRCRSCRAPIPRRYIAIESGCAVIGLWAALAFDGPMAAATAGLGWTLILIAVIDAEHFWLPLRLTLPLLAFGLGAAALQPETAGDRLIGAGAGYLFLHALAWAYRRLRNREGLGGGDPPMLAAAGAWVGWQGLPSVLLIAALLGLAAALLMRKLKADARLPFGSLMAAGVWLVWLYGPLGA